MRQIKILCLFSLVLISSVNADENTFVNPITDVCWECLFPITVSGVNITPQHKDTVKHSTTVCACAGIPPKIGIPLTFWEPTRLVDVTRHAYKLIGLGGITVGNENVKNRGIVSRVCENSSQTSFYHVHWYSYPIFSLLEIFTDFTCIERENLDVAYITELDPLWNDDRLSFILNPEATLAEMREEGLCHYVGSKKGEFIDLWKSRNDHVFCCFSSKLARILQEQAREQLNDRGWGEPKKPDCLGLSLNEIQQLDFTHMDFSELEQSISANIEKRVGNLKEKIQSQLQEQIEIPYTN